MNYSAIGCSPYGCGVATAAPIMPAATPWAYPRVGQMVAATPAGAAAPAPAPSGDPTLFQRAENYLGSPLYEGSSIKKGYAAGALALAVAIGVYGYNKRWYR